ncbi:transglutaminase family protein [Arachnia propionica]|jgi:hypothetical protein|nr:transglutaminase-like protein [Arachnia propionica F0230a]QCT39440.1 transglutaminase family protein [Arachnia propionica]RPA18474.1 transglutaminase family protein [Arachnia propionica]VEH71221.1 Transglutaminase-like superfamily [Arachnia propionica]
MTHLGPTPMLDLDHPRLRELVERRGWVVLEPRARIGAVYDFVRNEIPFGYNASDLLPASRVLDDGHGQCNTKATLLMALLRATGIECRFHGATIRKELQKGVVTGLSYVLAPGEILHSWAEARFEDRWVGLEGVILDSGYLRGLRRSVRSEGEVLGYGAGTEDIADPPVVWCGMETAIQKTGIARDLGIFDDPDSFYQVHGENLSGFRGLLYKHVIRHRMNRRVAHVRNTGARL